MALLALKTSAGREWLSVGVYADRIDVAHVQRTGAGRAVVRVCESFSKTSGDTEALKALARTLRPNRFRCSHLLQASEYQMQLVEAPNVPAVELKSAVRWKLKDLLDYPVDSATIDVADIPSEGSGNARAHYVYAVSARNDRLRPRMELFRAAKFPLQAIDVPEMAQRNVAQLFEEQNRGLALLAFDDEGGLLTFTRAGELYMSRRTEITASQLVEVNAGSQEAVLERLVLELQRSLDHFDRQFSFVGISQLLIAPLSVDIGLDRHLGDNLGVPVKTLDLNAVLDFDGAPELRDPTRQGYRLHILGAALRQEGAA
jgi:MSHA biogenesis protein MshI